MSSKRYVPWEDIVPRRELIREGDISLDAAFPEIRWDHLTLYDQAGNVVVRSDSALKNDMICLTYNRLTFVATPGYDNECLISIEWESLIAMVTAGVV